MIKVKLLSVPLSTGDSQLVGPSSFIHAHPLPNLLVRLSDHVIIAANKPAITLLKKQDKGLINAKFLDFATHLDKQKLKKYLQESTADSVWSDVIYFQVDEEEIVIVEVYGCLLNCDSECIHHLTLIDRTSFFTQHQKLAYIAGRYKDFIEQSSEGIYLHEFTPPIPINISDAEFVQELKKKSYITECNNALARMYGFEKAEEMRGLSASLFVDFNDPLNIKYLKQFKQKGLRILDTESKEVDRYGNPRYFLNSLVSVVEDGFLKRVWGTQRDITEKREFEKKVRLLTSLVEHTSDVLIAIDKTFRPLTWNKAAERIFGLTAQQVIGKSLKWYIDLYYQNATKEEVVVRIYAKGEWRGEIYFRRPTDEQLVTLYAGYKGLYDEEGNLIGYIISATDITQRIAVDKQIRLLASLVENTSDVLLAVDLNLTTISWNEAAERISGIKACQVIGRDVRELLDLHHYEQDGRDVLDVLRDDGVWRGEVYFIRPSDGQRITLLSTYKQLNDEAGAPMGFIISCIDITERKKAEWMLQASEERFRHMVQDLQVGVLLQDGNGQIIMANQIVLQHLGYTKSEIIGKKILDIVPAAINEEGVPIALSDRPLTKVLETKHPIHGLVIGVIHPKTREEKWIMLNIHPIFNDSKELIHIITSIIDITERKALEAKLRMEELKHQRQLTQATLDGQEKERREIGKELHDNIGQQLTTIKLYLEMALPMFQPGTNDIIRSALRSVSSLINEVRALSRSLVPPSLKDLGLVDSINDLIETLSHTQTLELILLTDKFDETQVLDNQKIMLFRIIQEQLNNIIKHAKAQTVWIKLESKITLVTLEISDDGIGFDPYEIRKGLGLTNIRNRAELFSGTVDILTAKGKGCTIKIDIPLR